LANKRIERAKAKLAEEERKLFLLMNDQMIYDWDTGEEITI
jgi:hypothetical protein